MISSERFLDKIWGYDSDAEINVVWVYISYLRKKMNALKADVVIRAARNAGYTLEVIRKEPEQKNRRKKQAADD